MFPRFVDKKVAALQLDGRNFITYKTLGCYFGSFVFFYLFCLSYFGRNPRTIGSDAMAVEAMQKMESPPSPVQFLPVIDNDNVVIGIVTLHGLVSAGL